MTATDLSAMPSGKITNEGFTRNIEISLIYLESWLRSQGCVSIFHLMEDAATAEISRAQLWQWNRYSIRTEEGVLMDTKRIGMEVEELLLRKKAEMGMAAYPRRSSTARRDGCSSLSRAHSGRSLRPSYTLSFRNFSRAEVFGQVCCSIS